MVDGVDGVDGVVVEEEVDGVDGVVVEEEVDGGVVVGWRRWGAVGCWAGRVDAMFVFLDFLFLWRGEGDWCWFALLIDGIDINGLFLFLFLFFFEAAWMMVIAFGAGVFFSSSSSSSFFPSFPFPFFF